MNRRNPTITACKRDGGGRETNFHGVMGNSKNFHVGICMPYNASPNYRVLFIAD